MNDRRKHVKDVNIQVNNIVLVKQRQINKTVAPFEPNKYKVTNVKGNMISAERLTDKRQETKSITRNITFFKKWRGEAEVRTRRMNNSENAKVDDCREKELANICERVLLNPIKNKFVKRKIVNKILTVLVDENLK